MAGQESTSMFLPYFEAARENPYSEILAETHQDMAAAVADKDYKGATEKGVECFKALQIGLVVAMEDGRNEPGLEKAVSSMAATLYGLDAFQRLGSTTQAEFPPLHQKVREHFAAKAAELPAQSQLYNEAKNGNFLLLAMVAGPQRDYAASFLTDVWAPAVKPVLEPDLRKPGRPQAHGLNVEQLRFLTEHEILTGPRRMLAEAAMRFADIQTAQVEAAREHRRQGQIAAALEATPSSAHQVLGEVAQYRDIIPALEHLNQLRARQLETMRSPQEHPPEGIRRAYTAYSHLEPAYQLLITSLDKQIIENNPQLRGPDPGGDLAKIKAEEGEGFVRWASSKAEADVDRANDLISYMGLTGDFWGLHFLKQELNSQSDLQRLRYKNTYHTLVLRIDQCLDVLYQQLSKPVACAVGEIE